MQSIMRCPDTDNDEGCPLGKPNPLRWCQHSCDGDYNKGYDLTFPTSVCHYFVRRFSTLGYATNTSQPALIQLMSVVARRDGR
jgi:hypothetical protein